ncbi:MAG: TIGR00269 family protein [Thermoplasmata archaeon]|nr:TIGR00269 family protein [Thermoplasmata archaeon]MCI4359793.1 TIGR00269 family protein [Thermoplasmata archaeon]
MQCARCPQEAAIDRPYAHDHLCEAHLGDTVWDRSRRELHRQAPRFRGGVVAVALSGGKDSAAALALTHRYFSRRPTVRVVAVSVDEGIAGYRASTLARAAELCERLGVEHRVVHAREELGTTTDDAARALPSTIPCSFCGVWRRGLLNRAARAASADLLVLGFNLDDLAQTVLMNLARGEVERLGRMAPHRHRQPGLVPRIAPLAAVPEREVYAFAQAAGLPFDHSECPHADAAERNRFREIVWELEEARPGTRQALLRTRDRIAGLLEGFGGEGAPGRCRSCGEPSAHALCRSCEYRREAARSGLDVIA